LRVAAWETTENRTQPVNLNNFYELLLNLSVNSAAPWKYTPAKVRTVYVLGSPIYNNRDFRLVDVALEVTTHRSGLTTEAWRIRVRDHNDLDETHILQPFRLPAMTLNWTEKAHGTKSRNPAPKTRYRIRAGGPFAAFADFAESLRLSERAVPTQEDATEIGQLFCEVLDRTSRATIVRSLVSANECHKWYECSSCQVY
jgi:hypothetical protein